MKTACFANKAPNPLPKIKFITNNCVYSWKFKQFHVVKNATGKSCMW